MYLPLAAADNHHQPSILCSALLSPAKYEKASAAEADQMRLCDGNQQHSTQTSCNGGPPAQNLHENKRNPGNFGAMREWNSTPREEMEQRKEILAS